MKPKEFDSPISLLAPLAILCFSLATPLYADIDLDGNGLGDVWEQQFKVENLLPGDDNDGDGKTNLEENLAGTNPLDRASILRIESASFTNEKLVLTWPSRAGKRYQVEVTTNFVDWKVAAPTQDGSGEKVTLWLETATGRAAFLGGVNRDLWLDVPGELVTNLTAVAGYPSEPNGTFAIPTPVSPINEGDNYGAKFRGYLLPPRTGFYAIGLESNHQSQLLVSRTDSPRDLVSVLQTNDGRLAVRAVELVGGTPYYFEILHKAGEGRDYCSLTWSGPGIPRRIAIDSQHLGYWLGDTSIAADAPLQFYRVTVDDFDTDDDGATDWEEYAVDYHPFDSDSQTPGVLDGRTLMEALGGPPASPATITIETVVAKGFEEGATGEPVPAVLRLQRKGEDLSKRLAMTLNYSGTATAGIDYGAPDMVTFEPEVASVDVSLVPEKDAQMEVPETVAVDVVPGDAFVWEGHPVMVSIEDYEVQEPALYVTTLTAEIGVETTASGVSSVWLSGDHLSATVALDFQDLATEQTAAHIHLADPVNGPPVESLELGVFDDHLWEFPENGAGPLTSAQAILDMLNAGRLYVNVHSSTYPAGEIRGTYLLSDGTGEFIPPEDPPPVPNYESEELTRDIVRFLTQATFGATEELVEKVRAKGIDAWIDEQMNHEVVLPTSLLDYTEAANAWEWARNQELQASGNPAYDPEFQPRHHNQRRGWFLGAIKGKDQLRQRVAFALSEIFVVSDEHSTVRRHQYGAAHYYDMLAGHAFGNYRELLEEVTLHPIMGNYLSMIYNEKANEELGTSPDENYAREVMQLLSIGLVELHPDGTIKLDPVNSLPTATYDNHDITELARVFTGWSYANRWAGDTLVDNTRFYYGGGPRYNTGVTTVSMKQFPEFHDTGEKVIVNDIVLPVGQTGEKDLEDTMDALFEHPNTASFISRRLIQRLVTSNPSRGYVYRIAQIFEDNGSGVRGDLGAVVKGILTDYEARSLEVADEPEFGKQREPFIRVMSLLRSLNAKTNLPVADLEAHGYNNAGRFDEGTGRYRFGDTTNLLSQSPLSSPSVFNWFMPDYIFPGVMAEAGMFAPEFQTTTETWVVKSANYKYGALFNVNGLPLQPIQGDRASNDDHAFPDFTRLQEILDTDGTEGLVHHLDLFWAGGAMSAETEAILTGVIGNTSDTLKVKTAVYLTVLSPDWIIQR